MYSVLETAKINVNKYETVTMSKFWTQFTSLFASCTALLIWHFLLPVSFLFLFLFTEQSVTY